MRKIFNVSCRRVGGMWWLKIGRFTFAFTIARRYKAL